MANFLTSRTVWLSSAPMGFPSHGNWKTNMPKMGTGTGRVYVTMGMRMATFSRYAKIPIGRLDANAIQ